MFEAFSKDKSSFKSFIFCIVLLTFMCFGASYFILNQYTAQIGENGKLSSTYKANNEWLQKFDFGEAINLQKKLLKPCKLSEVEKVQQEQLLLLQKHNLTVLSVRNEPVKLDAKKAKGATMKGVKTSVVVQGTWAEITAALNEFEKKHLVVITNLNLSNEAFLTAKLDYTTYYI